MLGMRVQLNRKPNHCIYLNPTYRDKNLFIAREAAKNPKQAVTETAAPNPVLQSNLALL